MSAPSEAVAIFERLTASAKTERKRQSLAVIWQVLLEIQTRGDRDYSISIVGRLSARSGGPRPQSIRNAGGAEFRELISSFAATNTAVKRPKRNTESNLDIEVSKIQNLAVRHALTMMLEERRRLKHENDLLRNTFSRLSVDVRDSDAVSGATLQGKDQIVESQRLLTGANVDAFERFLSDDWLDARGLKVGLDGSVLQSWSGDALFAPPGFVDGLRAVLGLHSDGFYRALLEAD